MEELGVFLHAPDPATGDIPNLTAQLAESNVRTTTLLTLGKRGVVYNRGLIGLMKRGVFIYLYIVYLL